MNIETTFWEETARLMQEYRKEGNEQRVQGIVDCRILFNRLTEQLRKHDVVCSVPIDEEPSYCKWHGVCEYPKCNCKFT